MKEILKPTKYSFILGMFLMFSLVGFTSELYAQEEPEPPNTEETAPVQEESSEKSSDGAESEPAESTGLNIYNYDAIENQGADNPFFTTSNSSSLNKLFNSDKLRI